jgi:hypothetical protein
MTPLSKLLTEIKDRLDRATPGPWKYIPGDSYCATPVVVMGDKSYLFEDHFGHDNLADCEFARCPNGVGTEHEGNPMLIANCPTDLAKLIHIIETQAACLDKVDQYLCEHIIDDCGYDVEKEHIEDLKGAVIFNSAENETELIRIREAKAEVERIAVEK